MTRKTTIGRVLTPVLLGLILLSGCGKQDAPSPTAYKDLIPVPVPASSEATTDPGTAGMTAASPEGNSSTASGENTDPASGEENATAASDNTFDFSLGFAGDINFADDYIPMEYLASIDSESIFDGVDQRYVNLMRGMDLMWINNEFVYSDRGEPLYGKMFTFRSSPSHVSFMHDLGVDIVGLANNHSYDYGEDAFLDTLALLEEEGIPYVGGGRTLQDVMTPVYLETNGFKIAYVAASNCEFQIFTPEATETSPGILWCYENDKFLEAIRTAAANADYVIALPHWGNEHTTELTSIQIEGAHAYIDAGADVVIGAHPHILQGVEFYNGKPILYSLGNFWFDGYDIDTVVAELHFTGERKDGASLDDADLEVKLYPGTQSGVFTAWANTASWRERIFEHVEAISGYAIDIDADGVIHDISEEASYEI